MGFNRPYNRIHDIGVTIYPEKTDDGDVPLEDDFYSSEIDDLDDQYVKDLYRSGDKQTEAVLCCAGCFTPLCYQCHFDGSSFASSYACNVFIEGTEVEGDEFTEKITNKRGSTDGSANGNRVATPTFPPTADTSTTLPTSNVKLETTLTVKCEECCNTVASMDASGVYHFKNIIANRP